jgi:hypothetical protein
MARESKAVAPSLKDNKTFSAKISISTRTSMAGMLSLYPRTLAEPLNEKISSSAAAAFNSASLFMNSVVRPMLSHMAFGGVDQ